MKNSQKGSIVSIFILVSIFLIGGAIVYINKDKILGNNVSQYIGNKLGACVIEENRGNAISPLVAQAVALDQVNKNNTPFNWIPVGYYPIYNSSAEINHFAFIFRKTDYTKFTTLESLEQNASKYSDTTQDGSDSKYQFNDIASVLTGATDGEDLIARHYRGIPEIVGKKNEIKKFIENKYTDKTIANIISDSSMGKMYFDIVYRSDGKVTGEIIGLDYVIISKDKLINNQAKIASGKNKQYLSFNQKECTSYKQALIERGAELKSRWNKYSQ